MEIDEACDLGADAIELRLDFLQDLKMNDPGPVLKALLAKCKQLDRPAIVTLRPDWEGCVTPDAAFAVHGAAAVCMVAENYRDAVDGTGVRIPAAYIFTVSRHLGHVCSSQACPV